jgi:hypothetical protein
VRLRTMELKGAQSAPYEVSPKLRDLLAFVVRSVVFVS